jgi:hypothetical protein
MAAGLYPLSRQVQFDLNGNPAPGARLSLYDGGTSTPRIGYRDLALSSTHPNPILADDSGRLPLIYLDSGYYRQRLTTSTGVSIFDDDGIPVLTTSAGGAGTSVDPDAIFNEGGILLDFGTGVKSGYVRANGRTIGSASSGATERANSDTEALYSKLWAFDNITVAAGKGADAAADFAANKPLTLPNAQGACFFGSPDQGGTVDSAFAALLTGQTDEPNATAGADTVTIAQANLPSYNLTGGSGSVSGTTNAEAQNHSHSATQDAHTHTPTTVGTFAGASTAPVASGSDFTAIGGTTTNLAGVNTSSAQPAISVGNQNATHTHVFTGTASGISISSGGSATPLNKLPSLLTVTVYIRL